ncbi:hypothetical protein BWP39_07020 [Paraburkholderia acidicola]|uniref:Uncharacterized protein n=1 Tax=Paraburkholderia acidicola TaxID=1912599 RepID=A0A2A4F6G6_9BURK|nr:hypothetical protein BWP39_07020 [Paraburkholderia acidicola]
MSCPTHDLLVLTAHSMDGQHDGQRVSVNFDAGRRDPDQEASVARQVEAEPVNWARQYAV